MANVNFMVWMVRNLVGSGKKVWNQEKELSNGPMEWNMKGNTKMIKDKVLESCIIQIMRSLREIGRMERNMDKVNFHHQSRASKDYGSKGN